MRLEPVLTATNLAIIVVWLMHAKMSCFLQVMRAILDLKYSERRRVEFLAMEVRHTPRHVPLWSDIDLQIVWRGFKHYACEDKEALRLVRKEMMFRDLPLRRRPPYM